MPTSTFSNTLTANQQPTTINSGDANEFVPFDAKVCIYNITSGASATLTAFADADLIVDNRRVTFVGTSLLEDNLMADFEVNAGTRLIVKLGEISGATPTVLTKILIEPI